MDGQERDMWVLRLERLREWVDKAEDADNAGGNPHCEWIHSTMRDELNELISQVNRSV